MRPVPTPTAPLVPVSRPDVSVRKAGNVLYLDMAVRDPRESAAFNAFFRQCFADWLRANFPRPEVVAAVFGVRNSTAWAWWNAENRPTGDNIAWLAIQCPAFVADLTARWQRRAA